MHQLPIPKLRKSGRQAGSAFITSLFALALVGSGVVAMTQCTDAVLLKVRLRERDVKQALFVEYLKNTTDCRNTLILSATGCDNTTLQLRTRSGALLDGTTSPYPQFISEATCWNEPANAPTIAGGNFRSRGVPMRGLPSRYRYGDALDPLPATLSAADYQYIDVTGPRPPGVAYDTSRSVHWNIWFTLRVKFLGDGVLPASDWVDVHYGSPTVPGPPGSGAMPWVCESGMFFP